MKTKDDITLVSPCGGYCGDCPAYKVKDDPSWGEVLTRKFNWNGVPCEGCRPLKGKCQFVEGTCETYACISKRGHNFCFECAEFPCAKFNPAADKAGDLPHNIKLFALTYIQRYGVDKWKEKTSEVKKDISWVKWQSARDRKWTKPVYNTNMNKEAYTEICRCPWVDLSKPDYVAYHDTEWGVPVFDDRVIFEFLTLEAAQAGLSWYTVLRKRDAYRKAYDNFEPEKVSRFNEAQIEKLMQNPGIIRNRLKIGSSVNNARRFLDVQEKFGSFSNYIWGFVENKPKINKIRKMTDYPATSRESDALSRDLKKRGFKFLGSTICYAHMQATGMVNDHSLDCFRRNEIIGDDK